MAKVRKQFSSVKGIDRVSILDFSQTGFSAQRGYPVQFMVQGPDWDKLADYAYQIRDKMKASGLMTDIDTDYNPGMPEIQVHPDRDKANAHGRHVAFHRQHDQRHVRRDQVRQVHGPRQALRRARAPGGEPTARRPRTSRASGCATTTAKWSAWPTSSNYETKPALFTITRYNRQRSITVYANPAKGVSQDEALKKVHEIAKQVLPDEYNILEVGQRPALQGIVPEPDLRADPGHLRGLHGAGDAVQQLHPPGDDAHGAALQRDGGLRGPVADAARA